MKGVDSMRLPKFIQRWRYKQIIKDLERELYKSQKEREKFYDLFETYVTNSFYSEYYAQVIACYKLEKLLLSYKNKCGMA